MSRHTYVLRSDPTDLGFLDTMQDALDHIKTQHGVTFNYAFFEEGGEDLGRHVYWDSGKQAILSLVIDLATHVRYLIIEAASQEEVERLGGWLEEHLPFISLQELQETARSDIMEDPKVLVRLALGTGEQADPVSLEILHNGLQSNDELVRYRAAEATSLTQWPEFVPQLSALAQNDPVSEVREMAYRALEACQRRIR